MIYTLQGLRALATLGIFLFHSGLLINGTFPVTFFFILSGFVTYYSKYKSIELMNFNKSIKWIFNKMKPFYAVHIITFLLSILVRWNWVCKLEKIELVRKVILNLLLIQTFSKDDILVFNNLSWFLSVIFILYIFAIPCIKVIKKIPKNKLLIIICLILVLQYVLNILNIANIHEISLYFNPMYRMLDFILGMIVSRIFLEKIFNIKRYNLCEISIVIIFIIMYLLSFFIKTGCSYYSLVFIIALYIFAHGKGRISKILENDILMYFANISFEFYMVHELILIIFRKVFINLNYHWLIKSIIISIPSFIISLILSILINKYVTKKIKYKGGKS